MRDLTKSNKAVVKKRERNTYKGVRYWVYLVKASLMGEEEEEEEEESVVIVLALFDATVVAAAEK